MATTRRGVPSMAWQGAIGIATFVAIAWALSDDRKAIPWRLVASALVLQAALAVLLLTVPPIRAVFLAANAVVDTIEADGMRCSGVLATHYHPDHVGGSMMGFELEGITALLDRVDVPIHVQADEAEYVRKVTGVTDESLVQHQSGDIVRVGDVEIELIHTPGHTPGSQCFLVDGRLVAGDTLFLDGCGRTDLPGSDPEQMYESLTTRLGRVDDDVILCPGHAYSPEPTATMGATRERNIVFRPDTKEQWMMLFGR